MTLDRDQLEQRAVRQIGRDNSDAREMLERWHGRASACPIDGGPGARSRSPGATHHDATPLFGRADKAPQG